MLLPSTETGNFYCKIIGQEDKGQTGQQIVSSLLQDEFQINWTYNRVRWLNWDTRVWHELVGRHNAIICASDNISRQRERGSLMIPFWGWNILLFQPLDFSLVLGPLPSDSHVFSFGMKLTPAIPLVPKSLDLAWATILTSLVLQLQMTWASRFVIMHTSFLSKSPLMCLHVLLILSGEPWLSQGSLLCKKNYFSLA